MKINNRSSEDYLENILLLSRELQFVHRIDVARRMGIPPEEITIVMINSRQSDLDGTVNDGDRVAFFPPVGGG